MSDSKSKQTQIEVLAEILEFCRKPAAKTKIMYKTNMSYATLQKFMKQLQKLDLLQCSDDVTKYITTEKGLEFIRRYATLKEHLKQ